MHARRPPCFWAFLVLVTALPATADDLSCPDGAPRVVVDVRARRLSLCEAGKQAAAYPVSLGRGGTGRRRAEDNRTPLGRYGLGAPRASTRYHVFIPVAYPTPAQIREGYSGGDIGIHGPDRRFTWAGSLNTWFNWTAGCIAVGANLEIDEIAAWARRTGARAIEIL